MIKSSSWFDMELNNGKMLVSVKGEIDHHSAVSMRTGIDAKIFEHRPKEFVFDLSEVNFMDSSGLGLIMGRYSLVKELGGEMKVLNPCKSVLRVLELAGFNRLIKIEVSRDA